MISIKARELKGLGKIQGLISRSKAENVIFKTRFGIHTFGLKFPIDVLILDKNMCVVLIKESLKPNRIFIWNPKYEFVLEMPAGEVKKLKLKIGDTIRA